MMKAQLFFGLSLATVFFYGAKSAPTIFTVNNNCPFTVWPGVLTGTGPAPSTTGFELASGASTTLNTGASWSGRIWGRTKCTNVNGRFQCETGDCGSGQVPCNGAGGTPPVSLAEFTVEAPINGKDFYDVSLVDGFNLPVSIVPQGGLGCKPLTCSGNINPVCPLELQVKGSDGSVVACKSACLALNQPQYCCTGSFGTPETCPPTNYSNIFNNQCPQAYAYAYDDTTALASCSRRPNYVITFCP